MDVVTDFARTALILGWGKTRECFDLVWKYVSLVIAKQKLQSPYKERTDSYLENKIKETKRDAQECITGLVRFNREC